MYMKIITVSREFGSGGRELGKRLAEELGFAYYDREIVSAIAEKSEMDENYTAELLEKGLPMNYPVTFGRTFGYSFAMDRTSAGILAMQKKIIEELAAQKNCVIVGRCANIILEKYKPFNLFVYADMKSKIDRCRIREESGKKISEKELIKKIKQVDSDRERLQSLISGLKWGDKKGYNLCVNTSGLQINELVPLTSNYAEYWFERNKK